MIGEELKLAHMSTYPQEDVLSIREESGEWCGALDRRWNVLSREPSGDRIARSCRHTASDLTLKAEMKDRIAINLLSQYVLDF